MMSGQQPKAMPAGRILVVDDTPSFLTFLVDALNDEGHQTVSVISGEDGIHELEEQKYDMAIVDLNLIGWISGLDLLEEIRGRYPGMIVIVCSAQTDKATKERANRLGAKIFIEKPIVDLDRFLDLVKETLLDVRMEHARQAIGYPKGSYDDNG